MSTPPIYTIAPLERVDEVTIARIQTLVGQLTEHTPSRAKLAANLQAILADPRSVLFVARNDQEEIVGMASGVVLPKTVGHEARLNDLVVAASTRGQGLGRRLVQTVMAWAWEHGAEALQFSSRPSRQAANALYQSMGFEQRETNVYNAARPKDR